MVKRPDLLFDKMLLLSLLFCRVTKDSDKFVVIIVYISLPLFSIFDFFSDICILYTLYRSHKDSSIFAYIFYCLNNWCVFCLSKYSNIIIIITIIIVNHFVPLIPYCNKIQDYIFHHWKELECQWILF